MANAPPEPLLWERSSRPTPVRVINAVGRASARLGVRIPRLDPGWMLRRTRRKSGLSDFGDPGFREGLDVLVASFDGMEAPSPFGRFFFREFCVRLLVNRLKVVDALKRHPEILDVPVRRPLVVTGLPRSGTTFLHRLLSEDPAGRSPLMWETLEPCPPPTTATHATDPRIGRARKAVKIMDRLAPRLATAHEFDAENPEETNQFFAHEFLSEIFVFMFEVPEYRAWLQDRDVLSGYQSLKRQLQLLGWKCPGGGRWVLKAPSFLYNLGTLLAVFPDACVVQTHRDPLRVMPSLCSLAAGMRGIVCDRVDPGRLGVELTEGITRAATRAIEARAVLDPSRFHDVAYDAMVADPIGAVQSIYRHFGDEVGPEFEARMRRWLADNPGTSMASTVTASKISVSTARPWTGGSRAIVSGWPGTSLAAVSPAESPRRPVLLALQRGVAKTRLYTTTTAESGLARRRGVCFPGFPDLIDAGRPRDPWGGPTPGQPRGGATSLGRGHRRLRD